MDQPKMVIERWVQALNMHDADQAAALYHDDAENLQVAVGVPLVGREAIRRDFEEFFRSTPDTFTKVENLFQDGEWAIIEWSGGGTFHRPDGQLRSYTLRGCGFFWVVQGKIKYQRGYWDKGTWCLQVGLPIE